MGFILFRASTPNTQNACFLCLERFNEDILNGLILFYLAVPDITKSEADMDL